MGLRETFAVTHVDDLLDVSCVSVRLIYQQVGLSLNAVKRYLRATTRRLPVSETNELP